MDRLTRVHGRRSALFTKLDICWGYNNIRMRDGNQWKAAFKTNCGLFEPMVMFFGLTNAPATFQSMMNHLFRELIDKGYVTIYMDDILIHTPNDTALHRRVVNDVLRILAVNNLYLKPQKCQFEQTEVVPRCYYPGRLHCHGPNQSPGCEELETTHNSEGSSGVPRLPEFLSHVDSQL